MPIPDRISFNTRGCPQVSYAVLDGVSAAYPPVRGRLHTCYSPVRRSPADESKLSSPLPLDLHVLSLSLAFILSQDQTLRCYLSFFFLFYFKKEAKDNRNCCFAFAKPSLFDSGLTPDLFVLRIDSSFNDSCTTLVYCKSFNVLLNFAF